MKCTTFHIYLYLLQRHNCEAGSRWIDGVDGFVLPTLGSQLLAPRPKECDNRLFSYLWPTSMILDLARLTANQ